MPDITRIFRDALRHRLLCMLCCLGLLLPCQLMAKKRAKVKPDVAFARADKLLELADKLHQHARRKRCSSSSLRPMLRGVQKQLSSKIKDRHYKAPKAGKQEQQLLQQLLRDPQTRLPSRLCLQFQVDVANIYVERATELLQPLRSSHPGRSHQLLGRSYLVYNRRADALRHIRLAMQYFIRTRNKAAYQQSWTWYHSLSRKIHQTKKKGSGSFVAYMTTQLRMNIGRAISAAVQQTYSRNRKDFDTKKVSLKRLKRTIDIYISLLKGLQKKAYDKSIKRLQTDRAALGKEPLKRWLARFCNQLKLYVKTGRAACIYRQE